MMSKAEIPLLGGRVTAGVVRLGATVRRPISNDRSLQHALLAHLERSGFDGSPRLLGVDEQDREILSFLPGEVPRDLGHFSDAQLAGAAALLRRFHDATASFEPVGRAGAEAMCHNDWGPPNAVFRDGLPYGMIDFDTIAPGLRLWDLGYSAFAWLDLGDPDYTADEQQRRLSIFADAYDLPNCSASRIAAYAVARQRALATSAEARGKAEMASWARSAAAWTVANLAGLLPAESRELGDASSSRV